MSSIEAVCPLSSFSFLIIGLLARQYPGVATSVKTGQAIRHVLNNMQERIQELRFSGGLDETEGSKLETVSQSKYAYDYDVHCVWNTQGLQILEIRMRTLMVEK